MAAPCFCPFLCASVSLSCTQQPYNVILDCRYTAQVVVLWERDVGRGFVVVCHKLWLATFRFLSLPALVWFVVCWFVGFYWKAFVVTMPWHGCVANDKTNKK